MGKLGPIIDAIGIEPYFRDDAVVIYHADCKTILSKIPKVDLVLTDPPYGIGHPTDYRTRGRSNLAVCIDYAPVYGDDKPFDPVPLLKMGLCILWGANHYSERLPSSASWLVWDKERPDGLDQSTCELAWSNAVSGVRRFRHLWNGMMRASERGENYHPTQKPAALMRWCLSLVPAAQTILDPFMGAGPVLRAAKDLGRYAIGIEIGEKYCEVAKRRMAQTVMAL